MVGHIDLDWFCLGCHCDSIQRSRTTATRKQEGGTRAGDRRKRTATVCKTGGAATEIADALKKRGFIVPKEEILVDKGPNTTEVRYFRESEKAMAGEIFELLRGHLDIKNAKLAYIPGYEASKAIRPNHYEIWLSKSS